MKLLPVLALLALLLIGCGAAAHVGGADDAEEAVAAPDAAPAGAEEAPPVDAPGGREEPLAPGGSSDYVDPDAPTEIASDEIASFSAYVSLRFELEQHPEVRDWYYARLEAERDGGQVRCRLENATGEREFTRDASFLTALQEIVARHNFAGRNGVYHYTYGLPDDFGATVEIEYASGEQIRFSDNQSMDLPLEAVSELLELFAAE